MKKIRNRTYLFIISFVMSSCVLFGFLGVCIAYENIVRTAFGEYKNAVEISKDGIRILDYEFKINSGL